MRVRSARWATALAVALLALLAYIPSLASSPGRMPADTKLYLYLDPGRLISDAPWTFDARQFAGWVPHQTIEYLWPQGPWYWLFEQLAAPDWVAQRLWIGTLFLAAGTGVLWVARRFGLSIGAVVASGTERVESLIALADQAMYQAKRDGRGPVIVEHPA